MYEEEMACISPCFGGQQASPGTDVVNVMRRESTTIIDTGDQSGVL